MDLVAASASIPFDGSDPLVMALTWALTLAVGRWCDPKHRQRWRPLLPVVAVLIAVALRAGVDVAWGEPITAALLARAFASGAGAVFVHSQFRELVKMAAASDLAPPDGTATARPAPPRDVSDRDVRGGSR